MNRFGNRGVWRRLGILAASLGALALTRPDAARADDPPAAAPVHHAPSAAGGLLGGVRPPVPTPSERAESEVADELDDIAAAPGHEAAAGALTQAREALARARQRRIHGETAASARALAVARAAFELAGRQAALARERVAASAAARARDAARVRASAAHEALVAAQREQERGAAPRAPADADAGRESP